MRFNQCIAMLALCLIALQCTANSSDSAPGPGVAPTESSVASGAGEASGAKSPASEPDPQLPADAATALQPGAPGSGPISDNPAGIANGEKSDPSKTDQGGVSLNPSGGSLEGAGSAASAPVKLDRTDDNPSTVDDRSIHDGDDDLDLSGSPPTDSGPKSGSSSSGPNPSVIGTDPVVPNAHGKITGGTVSTDGRVIDDLSDKKDHSTHASTGAAASGGLTKPHSSSPGTSKVGTINSSPGGTGVGVSAGSAGSISPGTNQDQTQDRTNIQTKISTSQNPGNGASSSTSSGLPLTHQPTQAKKDTITPKPLQQSEKDTSTSEDVHKKGDTTNNNKQQTQGQGNAGTPTDPKTVSNVSSNKGATKTPKPEPSLTTDTESKMNSTTTTTMAEDLQPKSDTNETSKTSTTTLAKQTKTLEQLQTLDKNDGCSSTPLIFAFSALVTLALVSVISVS